MPDHCEAGAYANLFAYQYLMQIVHASDRLAIECHHQIALAQSSAFGRTVLFNRNDEHTRLKRQPVETNDPPVNRHILPGHTDVTAPDSSVARSEEHTSELQSLAYLVCRLLLE